MYISGTMQCTFQVHCSNVKLRVDLPLERVSKALLETVFFTGKMLYKYSIPGLLKKNTFRLYNCFKALTM